MLADEKIAGIVAKKLRSMSKEYFHLMAYCIMPNHVHLLTESIIADHLQHHGKATNYPVTDFLRLLKGGYSTRVQSCAEAQRAVLASRKL